MIDQRWVLFVIALGVSAGATYCLISNAGMRRGSHGTPILSGTEQSVQIPESTDALLLESGNYLLLESEDKLLLE